MAASTVFKQNPSNVPQDIQDPDAGIDSRASPFSVSMDVLLLLEDAKAVTVGNPEAGKIGRDLEKEPEQLRVYEVTFKAVLKEGDAALVFGMTRDHRVRARLGGGQ